MANSTKLYRSRTHRVFGGVAGGLADYFNVDVILTRLLFVIIFFAGGGGVLIYIVLWIITPDEPLITPTRQYSAGGSSTSGEPNPGSPDANITDAEVVKETEKKSNNRTFIIGTALILIGFLFLLNTMIPHLMIIKLWPLILIITGIMILVNETRDKNEPVNKTVNNQETSKTESHEI